ncbi:hypothetical protein A1Q2_06759 [Trichosporon asahii var. asahii CBS 8904]|uniref:Uncharacterized protein n=1 Tax=Trichosporon asahii var. asahii (strain CBS 8904) TaxID=1220162 RepID=K1VDQ7_TRIAC|nr:hypothetical protein A1Q2_06759 [Trichosporon asahii var. asahii CBS 8904]
MPRRSGSPECKRSAPSDSDSDSKPDIKPKVQSNNKSNRGRIDGSARSVLASIVIQRGIASALAEIDTVTAAQVRNQLKPGRQNLRKVLEGAAGEE